MGFAPARLDSGVRHSGNDAMSSIKDTSIKDIPSLPKTFNRLAWSNLAAQSAEQIALAAAPIVAVLSLGVAEKAFPASSTTQT